MTKNIMLAAGFGMIAFGVFKSFQSKKGKVILTDSQKNLNGGAIILGIVLLGATTLTNIPSK